MMGVKSELPDHLWCGHANANCRLILSFPESALIDEGDDGVVMKSINKDIVSCMAVDWLRNIQEGQGSSFLNYRAIWSTHLQPLAGCWPMTRTREIFSGTLITGCLNR